MKHPGYKAICLAVVLLAASFSGCAGGGFSWFATPSPVPSPTASPTPTPVPPPAPVIAVFGAEASASFAEGVSTAAKIGRYPVEFVSGGLDALASYRAEGAASAIVFLENAADPIPTVRIPLYLYAADGQAVSANLKHPTYTDTGAAVDALNLAIAYPPHETPVRMIGLFTSETSRAYTVWSIAATAGRVFSKAAFFESQTDQTAEEWLNEQFAAFYPGMLDAVYAETGELAVLAAGILEDLGRDDMEVFAASTSGNADRVLSGVLVAAVGADLKDAGALCYAGAQALLSGRAADSGKVFPEQFLYSPEP